MLQERKIQGMKKNKLLRYKTILEEYNLYKTDDIPCVVIYRKYIYPKFFISRMTLHNILCTSVNKELKEIEEMEQRQLKLFN